MNWHEILCVTNKITPMSGLYSDWWSTRVNGIGEEQMGYTYRGRVLVLGLPQTRFTTTQLFTTYDSIAPR